MQSLRPTMMIIGAFSAIPFNTTAGTHQQARRSTRSFRVHPSVPLRVRLPAGVSRAPTRHSLRRRPTQQRGGTQRVHKLLKGRGPAVWRAPCSMARVRATVPQGLCDAGTLGKTARRLRLGAYPSYREGSHRFEASRAARRWLPPAARSAVRVCARVAAARKAARYREALPLVLEYPGLR